MIERWQISYIPFVIFLITFFLYSRVRLRKPKYFKSLFDAFFGRQMFEDKSIGNISGSISSIYMMTSFALMVAMTLHYISFGKEFELVNYLKILLIEVIFAIVYLLIINLFSFVFINKSLQNEYARVSVLNYEVMGLVLFVLNLLLYYLAFDFEIIVLIGFLIFFILKQIKSYSILAQQFSIFHNILYFCSLENIPLLLLIKVVLKS